MKNFGERLRYIQKEILKVNDSEFALILGVQRTNIKKIIDTNSTNIKNILPLKKIYNINLNWLLDNEGEIFITPDKDSEKSKYITNLRQENIILKDALSQVENSISKTKLAVFKADSTIISDMNKKTKNKE
jgi:hypothetical protein